MDNYYETQQKRMSEDVSNWSKGDLIDLCIELQLLESKNDAIEWSCLVSFDDLCEFVCYLLCGGWGHSRNITEVSKYLRDDPRIQKVFDYCDSHHLSE